MSCSPLTSSIALHGDHCIVATGQVGDNPLICVWDTATLQTLSILHGTHTRGVANVSFGGPDSKV